MSNKKFLEEPLIQNGASLSAPEQQCALESLDYEIVDNELYKQDWRSASRLGILHYTLGKWILAFFVGVTTGLVSLLINIAVENIAGIRFRITVNLLSSNRPVLAFLIYSGSSLVLVLFSALLCIYVAPTAAGSGVPEVEAYLNGVDCSSSLNFKTLAVKVVGIIGALSSGLMCGKAGPLVHMGACIAYCFGRPGLIHRLLGFRNLHFLDNDRHRQDLVTCGSAAGLAAAFRVPVGGVLFALEETASWWRSSLLWRTFFTTAVVALVLRLGIYWCGSGFCGNYGRGGLILFDVSRIQVQYGLLETVPVVILGIVGGTLGSLYNHLHGHFFLFNTRWQSRNGTFFKCLHALLVAFITSVCSFYLPSLVGCRRCPDDQNIECPNYDRVGNYKSFGCPTNQYRDLASLIFNTPEDAIRNLFSVGTPLEFGYSTLLIFTAASYLLALMTYGILVPSGLFVPSIVCGATYGRIAGMVMVSIYGDERLDESMYAVIGAASFLGGSMRMTVSLCVVVLELTNNLSLLPLVMLVLLVSKVVGDCFNNGIFKLHIDIKGFHFLKEAPPVFMTQLTARDAIRMPPVTLLRSERAEWVMHVLANCTSNAFPVLDRGSDGKEVFFGLVLRSHLHALIDSLEKEKEKAGDLDSERIVDLSPIVNQSPYTVVETMSLAKAYSLFRQLALRHLCVLPKNLEGPPILGLLTRHDFMHSFLYDKHPEVTNIQNYSYQNLKLHAVFHGDKR